MAKGKLFSISSPIRIYFIASIICYIFAIFPFHGHAASSGDWTGMTDQDLPISFTVSGNTVDNFISRIRVQCSGFSATVIQNLGSTVISDDMFTVNGTTAACTPTPPFTYRPYSFTCTFTDDNTCEGIYDYNSTQTGTWDATVPVCAPPEIVSFSSSPSVISNGDDSTLSWSISNATSASINQGVGSVDTNSGNTIVSPLTTTTYNLEASNSCGTINANTIVTVSGNEESALLLQIVPAIIAANSNGEGGGPDTCIPYGNIIIDGNFSDWIGIEETVNDRSGDVYNNDIADFTSVSIVSDGTYLYIMFVLDNSTASTSNTGFETAIQYSRYQHTFMEASISLNNAIAIPKIWFNGSQIMSYPSSFAAFGNNNVEFKVRLSDLPVPIEKEPLYARSESDLGVGDMSENFVLCQ